MRTFWLFLSQVMAGNVSCHETVLKALAWLCYEEGQTASPNTAAYCKARGRLKDAALKRFQRNIADAMEAQVARQDLWQGRRVRLIDGSSISMPDTPANQQRWPQPKRQAKGCGFPVMRVVVMFSLATGAILYLAHGPLHVSERALFRRLWRWLEPGDVALNDRGFTAYADIWHLLERGVDSVMRNHQRRSKGVRTIKRLGRSDRIVAWSKTAVCPKWLQHDLWRTIPEEMTLRQISIVVKIPGFRTEKIDLVTTLLDPKAFPKECFSDLYRKRWLAELFLRDIKISMGMDVLKCKTPAMIRKELQMYIIAYNLIRALMLEAAARHHPPALRISFKRTADTLRQWGPVLTVAHPTPQTFDRINDTLLSYIAKLLVPDRPNRVEPRARKRRPKNYQLLNKPRSQFKEIMHRNKYKVGLS